MRLVHALDLRTPLLQSSFATTWKRRTMGTVSQAILASGLKNPAANRFEVGLGYRFEASLRVA
jgi:hypothetical protein